MLGPCDVLKYTHRSTEICGFDLSLRFFHEANTRRNMPTFAITGANSGLGLEITRQLSARGDKVYALCRNSNDALAAVPGDVTIVPGIDQATDEVTQALSSSVLAGVKIDVLVNNAGVYGSSAP